MKNLASLLLLLVSCFCHAQSTPAQEFPAGAVIPTAEELRTFLGGKAFSAKFSNGSVYQNEFSRNGYLIFYPPGGAGEAGQWRTEDGKLCGSFPKMGAFCNEARFVEGVLYLRRTNGEIVRYDARAP